MSKITLTVGIDDNGPDIHFEGKDAYDILVCAEIGLDAAPSDFMPDKDSDRILVEVRSLMTRYEEIKDESDSELKERIRYERRELERGEK